MSVKSFLQAGLILFCIAIASIFFNLNCDKNALNPPDEGISVGFLTALPLNEKDIELFVNLGHLNPPGHTFPSDHGGFYLKDWQKKVNVYAPGTMKITEISVIKHISDGITDYTLTLSSEYGSFKVVLGHLSGINDEILAQAPPLENDQCENYMAGGKNYQKCTIRVKIPIQAGEIIGIAGGNPGQYGVDFGTFDQTKKINFATNRFNDYQYPYTVSPLDYFTDKITKKLTPICGDYICGARLIRATPPIGGTVTYDIAGTAQGFWFKKGASTFPEDVHVALIFDNVEANLPVFSVGTSIDGLKSGLYTFQTKTNGILNRAFKNVVPDDQIYRYEITHRCKGASIPNTIILLKMLTKTELQIECQNISQGPDWKFTSKAVNFER
ncbi:hypothetical protein JW964_10810 [candidate division KSB1 bacterium]|nr:hypothetical protein [candidate division KSB1 bacterium]